LRFRDLLNIDTQVKLEVAMGLETIHPLVGPRLNKGVTPEQFAEAAKTLRDNGIALRVFVLVKPPFLDEAEALLWANRSLDFAFDCGATVVALIPTRPGNGALEELAKCGEYAKPQLATLEAAAEYGISQQRGRVFADLWDLTQFSNCACCLAAREERLNQMNRQQTVLAPIICAQCGDHGSNN
jgi:radical SAM enzyme (TIGR01210 family)